MGWQTGLQSLNGQSLKGKIAEEKLRVFNFSSVRKKNSQSVAQAGVNFTAVLLLPVPER